MAEEEIAAIGLEKDHAVGDHPRQQRCIPVRETDRDAPIVSYVPGEPVAGDSH